MLTPLVTAFPANVVDAFERHLARNRYVDQVVGRPIREADANMTLGIHVDAWEPDGPDAYNIGQEEPVLQRYPFVIEYMVKYAGNEAEGRNVHSVASKSIRAMLYRDQSLVLQLHGLSEEIEDTIERVMRVELNRQRFFSNRIRSSMIFLSVIQGYVQTELTRLV